MTTITVSAFVKNNSVTSESTEDGLFHLNPLHQLITGENSKGSHRPGNWSNSSRVKSLSKSLGAGKVAPTIITKKGRNAGTYVCEELLHDYFRFLDANYHHAMLESFSAASAGDGDLAVESAQKVARTEGKAARKALSGAIFGHTFGSGAEIGICTNIMYVEIWNKDAQKLRDELGVKGKSSPRDKMSELDLLALNAAESMAAFKIKKESTNPDVTRNFHRHATRDAARIVRESLGISRV